MIESLFGARRRSPSSHKASNRGGDRSSGPRHRRTDPTRHRHALMLLSGLAIVQLVGLLDLGLAAARYAGLMHDGSSNAKTSPAATVTEPVVTEPPSTDALPSPNTLPLVTSSTTPSTSTSSTSSTRRTTRTTTRSRSTRTTH